jgi:hypothetical protein
MAVRWAVQNGNWSNTATWDGGTLPTSADDVYADGKTVTIDQDITVLSIRTTQRSGGTAGGGFTMTSAFNGSGNIIAGSTSCLSATFTSSTASWTGDVFGGASLNAVGLSLNGIGLIWNHVGNITAGGAGSNTWGVSISTSSSVSILGNISGGTGTASDGCRITGLGVYNITGIITGGSGGSAFGVHNQSNNVVTITGNITGGTANPSNGVHNISTGQITITGNATASSSTVGINNTSTGTIIILGNAIGSTNTGALNNSTGILRVTRSVASTGNAAAAAGVSGVNIGGTTVVQEIEFGSSGQTPISGFVKFDNAITILAQVRRENNTNVTLVDASNIANELPTEANVRQGTSYNSGNKVGTLAVPSPSDVRRSVPIDNTVGTADLTAEDFWTYATRSLTEAPDVPTAQEIADQVWLDEPERLKNVATVETTGDQLAAL